MEEAEEVQYIWNKTSKSYVIDSSFKVKQQALSSLDQLLPPEKRDTTHFMPRFLAPKAVMEHFRDMRKALIKISSDSNPALVRQAFQQCFKCCLTTEDEEIIDRQEREEKVAYMVLVRAD